MKDPIEAILCEERLSFSEKIDKGLLQDSFSWRSATIARELALHMIDDRGKIDKKIVRRALAILEVKRFSLAKERHHDADYLNQIYHMLALLEKEGEVTRALMRISAPYANRTADRVIRATLYLPEHTLIGDREARRAACAALFCQLRQNVGSCFATAPAIRIQQEYPHQMLIDIALLFGTRQLKRVIEGIEYAVPFSISFGLGSLLKPILTSSYGAELLDHLSASPSLLIPLEEAHVIPKGVGEEAKQKMLLSLLQRSAFIQGEDNFVFFTAEQLFQMLLMTHFNIRQEEIDQAEQSSFGPMGQLVFIRGGREKQREFYEKALRKVKESFVAMTDNPLLKAWEFTLASLSESKADFTGWNLYASLGLNPQEESGIGEVIHQKVQQKMELLNKEIEELQLKYEQLYIQAKHLEGRINRSHSESEANWLHADYNVRKLEINHALILRDEAYMKAEKLRALFLFLLRFYQEKCKSYFQEVYDPEMHDVALSPYDDSPAGFRLLYKHGRDNPSLWSYIHSLEEYKASLVAFFTATEVELTYRDEVKGVEKELTEIVTGSVLEIKEEKFLENSFYRLARAYREVVVKEPLQHLAAVKRKPWAYVSGGTMMTLLQCYYGLSSKVEEKSRWVESESELLAFYLDSCRELPAREQKLFLEKEERSLLAYSPTHAFLLKPGYSLFAKGWQSDLYSYSWIRDEFVNPAAKHIAALELDQEMTAAITLRLCEKVPMGYRSTIRNKLLQMQHLMAPMHYREEVVARLSYEKWLQRSGFVGELADHLDAILYETLPFSFGQQLESRVVSLCEQVGLEGAVCEKVARLAQKEQERRGRYQLIGSQELLDITKGLLVEVMGTTRVSVDLHGFLQRAMHELEYALRQPLLFADTNWVKNRFGFMVSPGTLALELWRFDRTASMGRPMSLWKEHLNGQSKGSWGILTNPRQYSEIR